MSGIEILLALGTALGAAGTISSGIQQKRMADYNAQVAESQALAETQAAEYEADRQRENTRRLLAAQRARYGASGVSFEGSPLLVMAQTAADAELDARAIEYGGAVRSQGYQTRATMSRYEGRTARQAAYMKAGTSLLTGAGRYFGGKGLTVPED